MTMVMIVMVLMIVPEVIAMTLNDEPSNKVNFLTIKTMTTVDCINDDNDDMSRC